MFTSITKYFFTSGRNRENSSENEADETKTDQDGWVFVERPSEYYGDYEDNTEDDDNDRGYSPIRSSINRDGNQYQGDFLVPPPPPRSPKINGHLSRSRHMSGGSMSVTRSGDELDQREEALSSDERQHQHSDFERYRGPFWNILEDEEQEMKKEGGVLSSASSQPEIVHIPSHKEHWILSPAPCFGGKPETCLKGSMEDLLIERPTTSIYLKFMGKNGVNKNDLDQKSFSPQRRLIGDFLENEDMSECLYNEKNGFESFDSRLVTYDSIYPQKNSTMFHPKHEKDNDGWSSESSTRDHSLSRPPIGSFAVRRKHRNIQGEEGSEMLEERQRTGRDQHDDLPASNFVLPFEDDEVRTRGKRKLLNKHQRSHRTGLWQKPRKASSLLSGCKL